MHKRYNLNQNLQIQNYKQDAQNFFLLLINVKKKV